MTATLVQLDDWHASSRYVQRSGTPKPQVIRQVNRSTFERMKPPLAQVCRYISVEGLREALAAAHNYVSYLKFDWLQTVSESCTLEDL